MTLKEVAKYAYNKGYRVDDNGSLLSPKNTKLKPRINKCGYFDTNIRIGGKLWHLQTHTLCAYQKFGDKIFECECIRHLDGDKLNNRLENIEIGTYSDNRLDIPKHIRVQSAKTASKSVENYHDKEIVEEVKRYHEKTQSYKETMKKFNITSNGTLYYMLHKR